jgi:hypothetical protein
MDPATSGTGTESGRLDHPTTAGQTGALGLLLTITGFRHGTRITRVISRFSPCRCGARMDKAATSSGHHGFAQGFSNHSEHSPDSALGFDCVGTTDVDRNTTIGSVVLQKQFCRRN